MYQPENNEVVAKRLKSILPEYPNLDCFIMDRNCLFKKRAEKDSDLSQIKYYVIDKWHGQKHNSRCPCRPQSIRRLGNRIKGLNTPICEQTFNWFKGYAKQLNNMRPLRHQFLVLHFCKRHNELIDAEKTSHLNPYSRNVHKNSKSYGCGRTNKNSKKGSKTRKAATSFFKKSAMKIMKKILKKKTAKHICKRPASQN